MKLNITKCAGGIFLLITGTTGMAQSTWNYFISNAGGGNSLVTWSVSGNLATAGGATWTDGPLVDVSIIAPGIYADSYVADGTPQSLPVPDGSYFTIPGQPLPLTGYYTYNAAGSSDDGFGLLVSLSGARVGDLITYSPGTQSALIPVDYSDFNPGTYQSVMSQFSPGLTVNLTVGPVPEPSVLVLTAGLGMGAAFAGRKKKWKHMGQRPPAPAPEAFERVGNK